MRANIWPNMQNRLLKNMAICGGALMVLLILFRFYFMEYFVILFPTSVAFFGFFQFCILLEYRINDNLFAEIGFVYLLFALIYTAAPAYAFIVLESLSAGSGFENLALLMPELPDLGVHLWRHVIFIIFVGIGYLMFRGNASLGTVKQNGDEFAYNRIILPLLIIVVTSVVFLWIASAPVNTYIENYIRYDHLPWLLRRMVTLAIVAKMGGEFVLLVLMFNRYEKYKIMLWLFVLFMAVYEVRNSFGSRIEAFFLLIGSACLYHIYVKKVSLKKGVFLFVFLGMVFSGIEVLRSTDFDLTSSKKELAHKQGLPAGELGAVYFPGYHLYSERNAGTLPAVPWQVFINDFISIVPFVDQTKFHPMYWYAKQYYPNSVVPPITLGPIADSALGGGEIDLAIRAFVNGLLFAFLAKKAMEKKRSWRFMVIYVFCYSTGIMCLKYSIFYHITPVVKIIFPLILFANILAIATKKNKILTER